MSISIYSFVNDKKIVNKELKGYYDIIQLNEDKLKGKLTKTELRKIKKLLSKEDSTDKENSITKNIWIFPLKINIFSKNIFSAATTRNEEDKKI